MMSGMELKLSASYDATPEEVFAIITDATFREQACEKTKALSYDVEVKESGGDTIVRVRREMPSDNVPDNTPVTLKGTAGVKATGTSTVQSIDLDVKVAVPLIGKKIEPFVVDAIRAGLEKEHELARDWTH